MHISFRALVSAAFCGTIAFVAGLIYGRLSVPVNVDAVLRDPHQHQTSSPKLEPQTPLVALLPGSAAATGVISTVGTQAPINLTPPQTSLDHAASRLLILKKFVSLSSEQEQKLTKFFRGELPEESLKSILGEEQAKFYQTQVEQSFEKAQFEEIEKEQFYLAKKLELSPEQEIQVRSTLFSSEFTADENYKNQLKAATTAQEKLKLYLAQQRQLESVREIEYKSILSEEQFMRYQELQASSSASDLELFHDPGSN